MIIYTIGFTKKTAEVFFEALRSTGARHLLDIRLHNTSQLAGFTKRDDLRYFLGRVLGMEYHEAPVLAPDEDALRAYRKSSDWTSFEQCYLTGLRQRQAERLVDRALFEQGAVLLCSEPKPERCHRRLAAEYLKGQLLLNAVIAHL
ncbi:MAG: DUF488 domain-containing protein [Dehalococcoidia bacterium]|nr:DUF488 domain-containing protein [Dehalococcoidia bacterium]